MTNVSRKESLVRQHTKLDEQITDLQKQLRPDDREVSTLKRKKLLVKEQIAQLELT